MRTPRKSQPAPSAQTTSSAHGLGGWSSWAWACGVASSNRLALARRLRFAHVCSQLHLLRVPTLTNPPVLTPLILGSAPQLAGCKRLHLTFSPSWAARSSGRVKTRIVSTAGCVRRAGSGRPRAHRRRPRPTVWVGGRAGRGPAVSPAQTGLRSPVVCGTLAFAPNPAHPGYPLALVLPRSPG